MSSLYVFFLMIMENVMCVLILVPGISMFCKACVLMLTLSAGVLL